MSALGRAVAVTGILIGILILPQSFAFAADEGAEDGSNVTVTVTDGSTSTPRPTPSSAATGTGASTGTKGGAGGEGGGASETGQGAGSGAGTVSIAGMVYVSGVNSSVSLSPDPGASDVTLWVTVRNASTSTIDLSADFWMESVLFGVALDDVPGVAVTGLQPGETRVVSTLLQGAGQWGLVNSHVRITPPSVVDGTALTPLTRDAMVVVFPWLVVLVTALTVVALLTWRAVLSALAAARPTEIVA